MILPKYEYEYNGGLYQNMLVNEAIGNYVPTSMGVFKKSASYAFNDNSFLHIKDYIRSLQASEDQNRLTQEEYKESEYYRKENYWKDGLTEKQAQILAERTDRENFYSSYMKNSSMLNPAAITGMIIGGLPDPVNYIPFLGWSGRVAKTANLVRRMPALRMSANAMIGQTAFETVKQTTAHKLGGDIHWKAAVIDVALAGVIGGGIGFLGGLGSKSGLAKKIQDSPKDNDLAVAGIHISNNKPVENIGRSIETDTPEILSTATKDPDIDPTFRKDYDKELKERLKFLEKDSDQDVTSKTRKTKTREEILNDSLLSNALRKTKSCLNKLF